MRLECVNQGCEGSDSLFAQCVNLRNLRLECVNLRNLRLECVNQGCEGSDAVVTGLGEPYITVHLPPCITCDHRHDTREDSTTTSHPLSNCTFIAFQGDENG